MDRGAGRATIHEAAKSWTQLSWYLSFVSMVQRRVNEMGNILLLIEFNNKRSLEVYRYIPFCLFTWMFIKDWERKNPWHPEAGLVSQQGAALLPLDVKALTELQPHTGSPWEQEQRRQQTPVTMPPNTTPPPLAAKRDCSFLPITPSASLCSPLSIDEVLRARW